MNHKYLRIYILHLAILALLPLTTGAADVTSEPFKDGDRVCFIGDSITHGGNYHSDSC